TGRWFPSTRDQGRCGRQTFGARRCASPRTTQDGCRRHPCALASSGVILVDSAQRPGRRSRPMSFASRCAVSVAAACGALCARFGTLVVIGWHTGALRLASGFLPGPPSGYLTGATMLLAGAGLIALAFGRPRLALPGGLFAAAAGVGSFVSRVLARDGAVVAT